LIGWHKIVCQGVPDREEAKHIWKWHHLRCGYEKIKEKEMISWEDWLKKRGIMSGKKIEDGILLNEVD